MNVLGKKLNLAEKHLNTIFRREKMSQDTLSALKEKTIGKNAFEIIEIVLKQFGDKIVLASSLGAEDQALTDIVLKIDSDARIFVLDTGRLNPETYDVIAKTQEHYGMKHEIYFPNTQLIEEMTREKGINLFYESIENRKHCCYVRKVEPLERALSTADAWITGLRRSQGVTRASLEPVEWDDAHNIIKINPLYLWRNEDVWDYIKENDVPYNLLHDNGYPSIGCAPCTRAVKAGEDIRAGRWWWEAADKKECGLHIKDGKVIRNNL